MPKIKVKVKKRKMRIGERRRYSYTFHIPERRNEGARRKTNKQAKPNENAPKAAT